MHRLVLCLLAGTLLAPASGSGKHPLTGRDYAGVMGAGGADWLIRPEREQEEQPNLAVELMGVRKGMTVADVGAGAGYFSVKLARKVGPEGVVFATDIQPRMLELLRDYAAQHGLTNIRPVLSEPQDAALPHNQVDLALLVDVYHEFSHPREMLRSIRRALKPGGRLVLIEYRKEDPSVPILEDHRMSVKTVRAELEPEGFVLDKLYSRLPRQHLFVFKRKSE